jgi:transposase-like protein
MTKDNRRVDDQMTQEVLLDDPSFLREIVERVVQQILEAEMTEHIGAAPYERPGTNRATQRPQAEDSSHQGRHAESAGASG